MALYVVGDCKSDASYEPGTPPHAVHGGRCAASACSLVITPTRVGSSIGGIVLTYWLADLHSARKFHKRAS